MRDYSILKEPLLADQLRTIWEEAEAGRKSGEICYEEQVAATRRYVDVWTDALLLPGETDLEHSLLTELGRLEGIADLGIVRQRCQRAMIEMRDEWKSGVREDDAESIVRYYDQSQAYIYELMWWHTLADDNSPLGYVSALHLAVKNGCRASLDFGAGVGSGSLLFARHGMTVALADISSTLQDFARRRLDARGVDADYIDLKAASLPPDAYDFVTAMDVFEHLAEPEETVDALAASLRPGGILFGRFAAELDDDRPSHIARDFTRTFERLAHHGFVECWRDGWLWGHQAFQKTHQA